MEEHISLKLSQISSRDVLILSNNIYEFLIVLVIDWVMRRTVNCAGTGIKWKMTTTLEDLDCTGDLALKYINTD